MGRTTRERGSDITTKPKDETEPSAIAPLGFYLLGAGAIAAIIYGSAVSSASPASTHRLAGDLLTVASPLTAVLLGAAALLAPQLAHLPNIARRTAVFSLASSFAAALVAIFCSLAIRINVDPGSDLLAPIEYRLAAFIAIIGLTYALISSSVLAAIALDRNTK